MQRQAWPQLRDSLLELLLAPATEPAACPSVNDWWSAHLRACARWATPIERAIGAGLQADRVGWAFASGYQAALRALLPELADDTLAAMCVSEKDGNSPKAIRSTLERAGESLALNGSKRWTTLGPASSLLLVAAVDRRAPSGERPTLRVIEVDSKAAGVAIETMPPTAFVPEVPHAQVRFDAVAIEADHLLPGDGYDRYVKPFRTHEDTLVSAAILAYLFRQARLRGWPREWCERAIATLLSHASIAAMDASAPATHLALAGTLAWTTELYAHAGDAFAAGEQDEPALRWQRDSALLRIAGAVRAQRAARAWERLQP